MRTLANGRLGACAVLMCTSAAVAQPMHWSGMTPGPRPVGMPPMGPEGAGLVDGLGDTFGTGPVQLDIDTMLVTYTPGISVSVLMSFHTPIAPASANVATSIVGYFEFDTDQSVGTGTAPIQNFFSPPAPSLPGVGVDFFADLSSESSHPGLVNINSTGGFVVGTVPIVFAPTSLSFTIPSAMLGGDDGLLNFTTIIGTFPEPTDATDVVGTSVVPAPASALVLCLGGLATARRRR
jgi:hypothetical protein